MTTEAQSPTAEREELISGAEAIAIACSLADVDVITAYPIRPYDTVMQYVSKLIADGEFQCEYIVAESEHSQFEIVKHASAVGARVFTGSSGVGRTLRGGQAVIERGTRINVEADSLNAAVLGPDVAPDEDTFDLFVREVAKDITQKAGQKCAG